MTSVDVPRGCDAIVISYGMLRHYLLGEDVIRRERARFNERGSVDPGIWLIRRQPR